MKTNFCTQYKIVNSMLSDNCIHSIFLLCMFLVNTEPRSTELPTLSSPHSSFSFLLIFIQHSRNRMYWSKVVTWSSLMTLSTQEATKSEWLVNSSLIVSIVFASAEFSIPHNIQTHVMVHTLPSILLAPLYIQITILISESIRETCILELKTNGLEIVM